MATSVGTLTINLQAGTAQFDEAMKKVQEGLKSAVVSGSAFGSAIGELFSTLTEKAGELAEKMLELGKSLIEDEDAMLRMSQAAGTTTEKLSTLAYAGKFSAVSTQELADSMTKLEKQMALAANGNYEARQSFQAIGVSVTDANGKMRDTGDVFIEVAKKLSGYRDDANKARLMQELFGRSGANLIAMMNNVGKNFADISKEAKQFNAVVGTESAEKAAKFDDNLIKLQESLRGTARQILNPMLPSLQSFIEDVAKATNKVLELIDKLTQLGKTKIPVEGRQEELQDVKTAIDQQMKEQAETVNTFLDKVVKGALEPFHLEGYVDSIKNVMGGLSSDLVPKIEAAKKAREELEKQDTTKKDDTTKPSVPVPPDAELLRAKKLYDDQIKQIQQAIENQDELAKVIGLGTQAQREQNAAVEANNRILRINNEIGPKAPKLTPQQEANIRNLTQLEAYKKAYVDMGNALDQQSRSADLAYRQQKNLTDATEQGTEAVREAEVQNQMLAITQDKDLSILLQYGTYLGNLRNQFEATSKSRQKMSDEERTRQIRDETAALDDETATLEEMIPAILAGDAAMMEVDRKAEARRQTREQSIAKEHGALQESLDALQTEGLKVSDILSKKQFLDVLSKAKQNIEAPDAALKVFNADLELQIAVWEEAHKRVLDYSEALQVAAIQHQAVVESLQREAQALLASNRASDGYLAFLKDLKANTKTTAQDVYDILKSAFEGFTDYLAKVLTGTKASFSDFLRSLAEMVIKAEITKVLTQLLTASQGKGGFLGALGSVIGAFAGKKQGGGWISADKAYLVGESGPEIITGASGYVHSNMQTRGMLGGQANVVNYTIDARGTDPVLTERRTRAAILAAHQSSVVTSVQVSDEMLKRKPVRIGGK